MMMLFTSVENCEIHNQTNGGGGETKKTRRRRRRIRADVEGSTESKKRKLSDEQVKLLEHNFGKEKKLEYGRKMQLASELGMDPKQVAVWFQNRRARWKNNQLEEEYMKLKSEHDVTVVQKCHLENEVLKLKEMLSEAEEKIKRFSGGEGVSGGGGGSSSSSSTTTTTEVETNNSQANLSVENIGGFGDDGDIMYMDDQFSFNNYNIYMDYGYYFGM